MIRKLKTYLLLMVVYLLFSCTGEKRASLLPVEDFFRNPEKTAFKISPDGRFISFLQPYKKYMNVFVQDLSSGHVTRVSNELDFNIATYFWASNRELVYLKDQGKGRDPDLFAVDRDGSHFRHLLSERNARLRLLNQSNVVKDELLIALNKRDSTVFDVYRLNLATGKLSIAEQNPGNVIQWIADEEGRLRLALASDGVNETLLFRPDERASFRPVVTNNFKTRISPVGFSDVRSNRIFALSNQNRDKTALVELDCSTGREIRTIFSHDSVDVSEAGYSPRRHRVMYAGYETWKGGRHYLHDSARAMYGRLEKLLPNSEIRVTDQDSLEEKFIVRTFTDKSPGAFYLYNRITGKLRKLSDLNPSIRSDQMCKMQPVHFRSADGLEINGYLTLPLGFEPRNLPVVVIPHGGPSSRNSWGFNAEVQFLANRGYAVLQINYRGSKGYGKKFWIAGFKKWGSDIQTDITAGVNWLIKTGIADKDRVAIYGTAFGGYSALYGLCFHPSLYKCGASQAGFVNLFTYIKAVPPYVRPVLQMYYEMVGDPEHEIDYFRSVSPVFHTDKIKAPVLIAQDMKDPRVNVNETNQFVKELKNRKIPITYLVRKTTSSPGPEDQVEFYRQLELFLQNNLKK